MTDNQKLTFFRFLELGILEIQQHNPEDINEDQTWEIQEIGEIPYGDGAVGVCANWWGDTFVKVAREWAKDNNYL